MKKILSRDYLKFVLEEKYIYIFSYKVNNKRVEEPNLVGYIGFFCDEYRFAPIIDHEKKNFFCYGETFLNYVSSFIQDLREGRIVVDKENGLKIMR